MGLTPDERARAAAEAAARGGYGKLVAFLAARTRDVAAAEDALSEAFASALIDWPKNGVPAQPEAWLLTAARRKLIDAARRAQTSKAATPRLQLMVEEMDAAAQDRSEIPDDRLALMFACAHPAIDAAIRAPLILQTVLGFDAATIASAFLVAPTTMGQRLSRAKARIGLAGVPFRIPDRAEMPQRLAAVLDAVYAVFAEGWADPAGADPRRRGMSDEAIWLGRLIIALAPDEAEALGLLALMLHAEARRPARRDAVGDYVPLSQQDPQLWDAAMIVEADDALRRASRMPGATGRYQLEAAVQSAHAARRVAGEADWRAIATLYDALYELTGSPVVAVNRAVAIAEIEGAAAGLKALDELAIDPRLADYQPYWAARAELAAQTGAAAEAAAGYRRAIGLERDPAVRKFLERRWARLPPARSA